MKEKAIIIDLDGTLCNTTHRQYFMEQHPKDWNSFYQHLVFDKPHEWCKEIYMRFKDHYNILFVSGRPRDYEKQTTEWLMSNGFPGALYMRDSGDFRKDSIIKEELYRRLIEPKYDVLFCIDDRKQVVEMWRSIGLTCLQCAEGEF